MTFSGKFAFLKWDHGGGATAIKRTPIDTYQRQVKTLMSKATSWSKGTVYGV